MKIFYAFSLLVLFALTTKAQSTVLLKENFSNTSSAFTYTTSEWEISSVAPESNSVASLNASGGKYIKTAQVSPVAVKSLKLNKTLSKIGYDKVSISWVERRTNPSNNGFANINNLPVKLYYSIDGSTFKLAANSPTTAVADEIWHRVTVALPEVSSATSFKFYLEIQTPEGNGNYNSNKNNDYVAFDDIVVTGQVEEDSPIAPLPVELASFKGQAFNNLAKLTWSTASEQNNYQFAVERSTDGKVFQKIGEVAGHGNSSSVINYSFTDNAPVAGISYYRLRQQDFDGTESFSKIVSVTFAAKQLGATAASTVYPTVASTEIKVSLGGADLANILVLDAAGKAVAQVSNVSREVAVPVQNLKSGVYILKIVNGDQQETLRFLKQ